MEYLNGDGKMSPPPTPLEEKTTHALNDYSEVSIGGVVYRVRSVFADRGQIGDLLGLAAMEKISRSA